MAANRALFFSFGSLLSCTLLAQSSVTNLQIRDESPLPGLQTGAMSYRTIPGLDEFYVQTGPNKYMAVDLSGHVHTALDTLSVPPTFSQRSTDFAVIDLSPVPGRGVVAPVMWRNLPAMGGEPDAAAGFRWGVLSFDEDGHYKELVEISTHLKSHISPVRIAEFDRSGGYLLLGYDDQGKLLLYLLDSSGNVVRNDLLPTWAKQVDTKDSATAAQDDRLNQAAVTAANIQLVSDDTNSIYAYSPDWGGKIVKFQPGGESSQMQLGSNSKTKSHVFSLAMLVTHDSIVIDQAPVEGAAGQANELKHFTLNVYSKTTGELLRQYSIDENYGGSPVAFSSAGAYFLRAKVAMGALSFSLINAEP